MNMKKILLLITLFTCALMPAMAKDYVDDLYVTVDGEQYGPFENSKVTVTDNGDGTINFALYNFMLITPDTELPVGNIIVENISATKEGAITSFTFDGIITATDGDDPEIELWAGPMLGELPTQLNGKMTDDALYVSIYIEERQILNQVIEVVYGDESKIVDEGPAAKSIFQLGNAGFEEWEEVTYSKTKGEEPLLWSSFVDGTGSLKSMAAAVQLAKSNDVRDGAAGEWSAKINARSVFGVVAQGNFTNGCVNMGSMTATDASGNYNYINEKREDQAMRFAGHPDSASIWLKVSVSGSANVSLLQTTEGYFQDPVSSKNPNTAKLVAHATNKEIKSTGGKWQKFVIPFVVDDETEEPYYCLTNISTSATPGKGAATDVMYIDDLVLIYNSEASEIIYDGNNILGTEQKTVQFDETKLTDVVMTGRASTYEAKYDDQTCILTVTVKGENFSEDNTNFHTYTIPFANTTAVDVLEGAKESKVKVIYDLTGRRIANTNRAGLYIVNGVKTLVK